MSQVARLYHVHGKRQREIADRLGMSQARVSRLLQQAEQRGLVHTVLVPPEGLHPELEEGLELAYGLVEAHVVGLPSADDPGLALAGAAARYLAGASLDGATIGYTSWSSTLRSMVRQMDRIPRSPVKRVVETLGDLGPPILQHEAARATQRLAGLIDAEPVFLRAPGVFSRRDLRDAALQDSHVREALEQLNELDVVFLGVGPADFHGPLQEGANFFTASQLAQVRKAGAVGQLNQRFLDAQGQPLTTDLDDLVIGITLDQLRSARRRIVVTGGLSKHQALLAALRGRWVDVLLTDVTTARFLLQRASGDVVAEAREVISALPEEAPR
ncbi:sugar-binding transcriptional regulator [Georgenia soli]|nr:sugar-binding domain-containing protein [Georgenia soli]